jgi:hypothetical protein
MLPAHLYDINYLKSREYSDYSLKCMQVGKSVNIRASEDRVPPELILLGTWGSALVRKSAINRVSLHRPLRRSTRAPFVPVCHTAPQRVERIGDPIFSVVVWSHARSVDVDRRHCPICQSLGTIGSADDGST